MNALSQTFVEAFTIISPVLLAGLTFIFVLKKRWFSFLKKPIDQNTYWRNKPLLGKNKTWLGFIIMSFGSMFWAIILKEFFHFSINGVLGTGLLGLTYSFGELPNSFIKRRYGIPEGEKALGSYKKMVFQILDTMDSVIVVALVAQFLYDTSSQTMITIIILGTFIHTVTDMLMVFLKLKK